MKRIGHFSKILCMSLLFLNSKGYLYDFKRRRGRKWRKIGFERQDKEFLNRINIIAIPDEVLNEYIKQTKKNFSLPYVNSTKGNSSDN